MTTESDHSRAGTKSYRGRSLDEILPQIRAELGADAVILREREGLVGGVGGFFAQRVIEVEARRGDGQSIDVYDDGSVDELGGLPFSLGVELLGSGSPEVQGAEGVESAGDEPQAPAARPFVPPTLRSEPAARAEVAPRAKFVTNAEVVPSAGAEAEAPFRPGSALVPETESAPMREAEPEPAPMREPEPMRAAEPEPAPMREPEPMRAAEPESAPMREPEPMRKPGISAGRVPTPRRFETSIFMERLREASAMLPEPGLPQAEPGAPQAEPGPPQAEPGHPEAEREPDPPTAELRAAPAQGEPARVDPEPPTDPLADLAADIDAAEAIAALRRASRKPEPRPAGPRPKAPGLGPTGPATTAPAAQRTRSPRPAAPRPDAAPADTGRSAAPRPDSAAWAAPRQAPQRPPGTRPKPARPTAPRPGAPQPVGTRPPVSRPGPSRSAPSAKAPSGAAPSAAAPSGAAPGQELVRREAQRPVIPNPIPALAEQWLPKLGRLFSRRQPVEVEPSAPPPQLLDTAAADALARDLLSRGASQEWADELISVAGAHGNALAKSLRAAAEAELIRRIVPAPPLPAGGAAVAFIGAGGSGKTRCTAAMASAYRRSSTLKVTVIALDDPEGARELNKLLKDDDVLVLALSGDEAREAVELGRQGGLVIVDTPAAIPTDPTDIAVLDARLAPLALDATYVTLPATLSPTVARRALGSFGKLRPAAVTITHVDETDQLASVMEIAMAHRIPLAHFHSGTDHRRALSAVDPAAVAKELLG